MSQHQPSPRRTPADAGWAAAALLVLALLVRLGGVAAVLVVAPLGLLAVLVAAPVIVLGVGLGELWRVADMPRSRPWQ